MILRETVEIHPFSDRDRTHETLKKVFFEIDPLSRQKDSNQRIPNIAPAEDKEKATANRGIFFQVKLPDKLEFDNIYIMFSDFNLTV